EEEEEEEERKWRLPPSIPPPLHLRSAEPTCTSPASSRSRPVTASWLSVLTRRPPTLASSCVCGLLASRSGAAARAAGPPSRSSNRIGDSTSVWKNVRRLKLVEATWRKCYSSLFSH
ncbi:Os07g0457200, partial [Oryza sativa Japonica Group]